MRGLQKGPPGGRGVRGEGKGGRDTEWEMRVHTEGKTMKRN